MPEHAVIEAENSDFDLKGQYQHNVKRISDYTGETKPLIVRIKPERREDHEGNAPELSTPSLCGLTLKRAPALAFRR
jgi:hypothetical protein